MNHLQFSMVMGRDSMKLPETFKTLSLKRQPMELGRVLSWLECTSNSSKLSNLAVNDSGMFCVRHSKREFSLVNIQNENFHSCGRSNPKH